MPLTKDIPRYTSALAGIIGLIFAVAPPAAYFALSWQSFRLTLEKDAETNAHTVSRFVAANPLMWQFDETRMRPLLEGDETRAIPDRRIIRDLRGSIAMSTREDPPWPVASRSHPVWDAGTPVGRMEIHRSFRPLARMTAVLGAASTLLSGIALTMFFLYPMSSLRKALDDLWELKERAQVTLQSTSDGVIATDTGGTILLMNRAAETITGWPSKAALGKSLDDVFRLGRPGGEPSSPGGPSNRSFRTVVSRLGEERLIEATDAPVLDRSGSPVGSVLVFRDVTEQGRMEDEQLRSRKLESLGVLAGGIAHDFNNLLTGILGNISLAKEMVDSHNRAQRRLEEAEKAALKAKGLATRLLAFSKGGEPVRNVIRMEEVLRDTVELTLRGTAVRCEYRVPEGVWGVFADAEQLGQVFHNLAINAVQAMPGGGTLRVSIGNAHVRDGEIPHVKAGNYVTIDMADGGTGIAADILPKIFDPYFTTKIAGSGLGLTTCYRILKNHGGNIFVKSAVGAGTTFEIYLPATGKVLEPSTPPGAVAASPGSATILYMDDEELVRDVVGEMLTQLGYKPEFARHGEEAISKYEEALLGPGAFDLVILDLTIPGGVGGKETASRILEKHPEARIIVSSGYSNDPVMANYKEYGFAGVIPKPYKLGELEQLLRQVLGRKDAPMSRPPVNATK